MRGSERVGALRKLDVLSGIWTSGPFVSLVGQVWFSKAWSVSFYDEASLKIRKQKIF